MSSNMIDGPEQNRFTIKDIVVASMILAGIIFKEGLNRLIGRTHYLQKPVERAVDKARTETLRRNGHPFNPDHLHPTDHL